LIALDDIAEGAPDLVLQRDAAVMPPTRAIPTPHDFFLFPFSRSGFAMACTDLASCKRTKAKGDRQKEKGRRNQGKMHAFCLISTSFLLSPFSFFLLPFSFAVACDRPAVK
jgi:hypothetical protein